MSCLLSHTFRTPWPSTPPSSLSHTFHTLPPSLPNSLQASRCYLSPFPTHSALLAALPPQPLAGQPLLHRGPGPPDVSRSLSHTFHSSSRPPHHLAPCPTHVHIPQASRHYTEGQGPRRERSLTHTLHTPCRHPHRLLPAPHISHFTGQPPLRRGPGARGVHTCSHAAPGVGHAHTVHTIHTRGASSRGCRVRGC